MHGWGIIFEHIYVPILRYSEFDWGSRLTFKTIFSISIILSRFLTQKENLNNKKCMSFSLAKINNDKLGKLFLITL